MAIIYHWNNSSVKKIAKNSPKIAPKIAQKQPENSPKIAQKQPKNSPKMCKQIIANVNFLAKKGLVKLCKNLHFDSQ